MTKAATPPSTTPASQKVRKARKTQEVQDIRIALAGSAAGEALAPTYRSLTGKPGAIEGDLFVCPEPDCKRKWTRHSQGEAVPDCPDHHIKFRPAKP